MARTPKPTPTQAAAPVPETPVHVRLLRPFGYINEDGRHRFWHAGHEVSDVADIETLAARGAAIELVEG